MKTWLAPLSMAIFGRRAVTYLGLAWLVSGTALAVYCWPVCDFGENALLEVGVRSLALLIMGLGAGVWLTYVVSLNHQLSPAAVQLVPQLRKSAIGMTIAFWLFMTSALTAQLWLLGCSFTALAPYIAAALAVAVSRAFFGALPVGVAVFVPVLAVWAPRFGIFSSSAPAWMTVTLNVSTIAAGAGWIVLQLGGRAESRLAPYERTRTARLIARDPRTRVPWLLPSRPAWFTWEFDRVLRIRSPAARALHGMSPGFHWSEALVGVLGGCCGGLLSGCFMVVVKYFDTKTISIDLSVVLGQVSLMTFGVCPILAGRLLRELRARQKEQALLLMLPGVPNGQAANRWILHALLVQHATVAVAGIVLVGVAMLLVFLAFGLGLSFALRSVATGVGVALLTTPALLQNYATMRASVWSWLLLLFPAAFVVYTLLYMQRITGMSVILGALLVAAILGATRYVRFRDAPPGFPVGRLAA